MLSSSGVKSASYRPLLVLLLSLAISHGTFAAATITTLPGTSLALFPHGSLVQSGEIKNEDFLIAAGRASLVNNRLRVEREFRLAVTGTRQLQLIAPGHSSGEVFAQLATALNRLGAALIFRCESRDCGRSSVWANQVFNTSKLYGKDGDQYYGLFRLSATDSSDGQSSLISVYTVRRGNGRVYLFVQRVVPERMPDELMLGEKPKDGPLVLPLSLDQNSLDFLSDDLLEKIQVRLQTNPSMQVWVVTRLASGAKPSSAIDETSSESLRRINHESESLAQEVKRWLAVKGVTQDRIHTKALGAFPPEWRRDENLLIFYFIHP